MDLLQFLAQASTPNIDRYLSYIDRGQVEILSEENIDEGNQVIIKVGSSSAKQVKFVEDDLHLVRISCSCRKNKIGKPCAHALAGVSEWLNMEGSKKFGLPTYEEDLDELKNLRIAALGTAIDDSNWLERHELWETQIRNLVDHAMIAWEKEDHDEALVIFTVVFTELSLLPIKLIEAIDSLPQTCAECQNLYTRIYHEAPKRDQQKHYRVLAEAYRQADLREQTNPEQWKAIHPAHFLGVLAAGHFTISELMWFKSQALRQINAVMSFSTDVGIGLMEALIIALVQHNDFEDARMMWTAFSDQADRQAMIEGGYSEMEPEIRKQWKTFFKGM